jgi:biopolymer transport protein TolR
MSFSMAGGGPSTPQMNVTPLIDVLMVLIIIFMIVVTQEKETGLKAQIPQEQQKQDEHTLPLDDTIVIQVVENAQQELPSLKINQEDVAWEKLRGRLFDIFKMRSQKVAFVRGDKEIEFQYVAEVIDIARDAGVERVGLLGKQN